MSPALPPSSGNPLTPISSTSSVIAIAKIASLKPTTRANSPVSRRMPGASVSRSTAQGYTASVAVDDTDPHRHLLVGGQGAHQALVSERGLVRRSSAALLRRALLDCGGGLHLLPSARRDDGV